MQRRKDVSVKNPRIQIDLADLRNMKGVRMNGAWEVQVRDHRVSKNASKL